MPNLISPDANKYIPLKPALRIGSYLANDTVGKRLVRFWTNNICEEILLNAKHLFIIQILDVSVYLINSLVIERFYAENLIPATPMLV